jgi:F-type H+-transporting ATPase subunit b
MAELLAKLGVNWQLLIAQIVNFTIVVVVLGYFVYKPILNLLDTRAERIRKSMEDAKRIENHAKELEEIRQREMRKLDQESGAIFDRTKRQAEAMQQEMVKNAKKEVEQMLASGSKRIEEERRQMLEEVLKTVNVVVVKMTEKILAREFTSADQKRILDGLAKDLPSLLS